MESLLKTMEETGADFTNSFRCLSRLPLPGMEGFESCREEVLNYLLTQCSTVEEMKKSCSPRMDPRCVWGGVGGDCGGGGVSLAEWGLGRGCVCTQCVGVCGVTLLVDWCFSPSYLLQTAVGDADVQRFLFRHMMIMMSMVMTNVSSLDSCR